MSTLSYAMLSTKITALTLLSEIVGSNQRQEKYSETKNKRVEGANFVMTAANGYPC